MALSSSTNFSFSTSRTKSSSTCEQNQKKQQWLKYIIIFFFGGGGNNAVCVNTWAVYHVFRYVLRCIPFNVEFKCHHLVAMRLQLALHHIVTSAGHLWLGRRVNIIYLSINFRNLVCYFLTFSFHLEHAQLKLMWNLLRPLTGSSSLIF